jgi:hypothetical protein
MASLLGGLANGTAELMGLECGMLWDGLGDKAMAISS